MDTGRSLTSVIDTLQAPLTCFRCSHCRAPLIVLLHVDYPYLESLLGNPSQTTVQDTTHGPRNEPPNETFFPPLEGPSIVKQSRRCSLLPSE
jgi:hypothetical protein